MAKHWGSGRYAFEVSNPDKMFFAEVGLSKADLIDYYTRVADVMLPHVRGRFVTMRRFPDGVDGRSFYQKDVPDYFPNWISTAEVQKQGGTLRQLTIENAATLAYLANQGCITIHVWPSRADAPHNPDRLVFDLDPSGDDFAPIRAAARSVRELFERVGLTPYVMTSGSRGLHVVAPLDGAADDDAVRDFAASAAKWLAAREPQKLTVEQRKNQRRGRVFLDYLRNAYGQHSVAPYSVRARPEAPVATPLDWDELGNSSLHPRKYTVTNLFRRLGRKRDPWRDIGRHAASVAQAAQRLEALRAAENDEP